MSTVPSAKKAELAKEGTPNKDLVRLLRFLRTTRNKPASRRGRTECRKISTSAFAAYTPMCGWAARREGEGYAGSIRPTVRDQKQESQPVLDENGRVTDCQEVVSDLGEKDKRLMVRESEFARVLQVAERETNTLSAIIRDAWDTGKLQTLTKNQAAYATGAHISIIGHITKNELRKLLTDTATANGFANRFFWVLTKRSKLLPGAGALEIEDLQDIIERLRLALEVARDVTRIERDQEARQLWWKLYPRLTWDRLGLWGSVTSRAEAQTLRLSCIYALLDSLPIVKKAHLSAAYAVWRYCEDSARYVFGDSTGHVIVDEILRELRETPEGMTRTEIREHFKRNRSSAQTDTALGEVKDAGVARFEEALAGNNHRRPTVRWFANRSTGSPA